MPNIYSRLQFRGLAWDLGFRVWFEPSGLSIAGPVLGCGWELFVSSWQCRFHARTKPEKIRTNIRDSEFSIAKPNGSNL